MTRLTDDRRCPVSGTRPPVPVGAQSAAGYWYDGGFHHCECGAVIEWVGGNPWRTTAVVSTHDRPHPTWAEVDALRAERDAAVNALGEGMDRAAVHYGDAIRAAVARAERAEQRIAHVEQQLEAGPPSAFSGVKRQGYNWCAEAIRRALSGEEGP